MIPDEIVVLPSFTFGDERDCTYCGDPATCRDHVIPVAYQTNDRKRKGEHSRHGPMCWACSDCNSHLSSRYFDSFKERCVWAHWRIERRVNPIIWSEYELSNLDYTLRSLVRKKVAKQRWMRQRADWYESRDFYLNLEGLIWEVNQLGTSSTGHRFVRAYFSSMLYDIASIYRH